MGGNKQVEQCRRQAERLGFVGGIRSCSCKPDECSFDTTPKRITKPPTRIVHKKPEGEYYLTICGQKVAHQLRENPLFHRTLKGGELVVTDHHYPKGSIPCETCYPVQKPKSRIPLFSAVAVVIGASIVFSIKRFRKK